MNLKQLIFCGLLFSTTVLSSCIINTTKKSYNSGINNVCELHNIKMHRTIVGVHYGLTAYQNHEDSPNAKMFRSGGCVVGPKKLAIIYHCKECDKIKNDRKKKSE